MTPDNVEKMLDKGEYTLEKLLEVAEAVSLAGLHVDPLAVRAKIVIDATGHASEICHIVVNKIGGKLRTKVPVWSWRVGEKGMNPNWPIRL